MTFSVDVLNSVIAFSATLVLFNVISGADSASISRATSLNGGRTLTQIAEQADNYNDDILKAALDAEIVATKLENENDEAVLQDLDRLTRDIDEAIEAERRIFTPSIPLLGTIVTASKEASTDVTGTIRDSVSSMLNVIKKLLRSTTDVIGKVIEVKRQLIAPLVEATLKGKGSSVDVLSEVIETKRRLFSATLDNIPKVGERISELFARIFSTINEINRGREEVVGSIIKAKLSTLKYTMKVLKCNIGCTLTLESRKCRTENDCDNTDSDFPSSKSIGDSITSLIDSASSILDESHDDPKGSTSPINSNSIIVSSPSSSASVFSSNPSLFSSQPITFTSSKDPSFVSNNGGGVPSRPNSYSSSNRGPTSFTSPPSSSSTTSIQSGNNFISTSSGSSPSTSSGILTSGIFRSNPPSSSFTSSGSYTGPSRPSTSNVVSNNFNARPTPVLQPTLYRSYSG